MYYPSYRHQYYYPCYYPSYYGYYPHRYYGFGYYGGSVYDYGVSLLLYDDPDVYYIKAPDDGAYAELESQAVTPDFGAGQASEVSSGAYATVPGAGDAQADVGGAAAVDVSETIERGNQAFAAGLYDEARQWYVEAVLVSNADGYANFLYAVVNVATGDYQVAGAALRQALSDRPELIDSPPNLWALYADEAALTRHLKRLEEFLTSSAQAGSAFPAEKGYLLLAYLHYAAGQPEQSLAVHDRLLAAGSTDTLASLVRDATFRALSRETLRP